jgi:hypothetical protein
MNHWSHKYENYKELNHKAAYNFCYVLTVASMSVLCCNFNVVNQYCHKLYNEVDQQTINLWCNVRGFIWLRIGISCGLLRTRWYL